MIFGNQKCGQLLLLFLIGLNASMTYSGTHFLLQGHPIVQLGSYWSKGGQTQHINIQDLIGDDFIVTTSQGNNGLVGLGYFLDGKDNSFFQMSYGINAFYLAKTETRGYVIQEDLFTNLSYKYNLTQYPVYAVAKSMISTQFPQILLTIDAGIGPNFIKASGFQEYPLDNITIPDAIFSGHTSTKLSVTAGIGLKMNQALGSAAIECGYRFFFLGRGHFNKVTDQVLDTLKTGNNYANAIMCSMMI